MAGLAARFDDAIRQAEAARGGGAPLGDPGVLFPETEEVAWRNEVMHVEHTSLRGEWRAVPGGGEPRREALDRLRHRLAAVHAELGAGGPGAGAGGQPQAELPSVSLQDGTTGRPGAIEAPPPAGWREKLTEILSRPEFKKQPAQETLLERLIKWLREKLGFLFPSGTRRTVGTITRWIIYTLAAAAVLLVLAVLVRAALPLFRRDRRSAAQEGPAPARPETPETLLALAEARTRAGDLRGAVQAMFRWLLLRLHMAGRLDYDPALTNREHLARLRADATVRAGFTDLSGQFDLFWYALRPVTQEEYAAFRARCQHLAGGRA